jgi:hypothetical protein
MKWNIAGAAIAASFAVACGAQGDRPDNASAFADIDAGRSGQEVIVDGVVTQVEDQVPGPYDTHEVFDIRVAVGAAVRDVEIADNVTIGEIAPVHAGDDVIVKGVLEIDPSGPVIHWTHHDPEFRHETGFVELGGKRYE